MKVLVIGANGQLGSELVATTPPETLTVPLTRRDGDVTDSDRFRELLAEHQPQAVINTAAFHKTDACETEPVLAFKVNTIAARDLAMLCAQSGASLVQVSTDYVFGRENPGRAFVESDRVMPVNTYGASKAAGEHLVQSAPGKHYIVRTASLFGRAGASGKGGNFVTAILKKARSGEPITVVDDICMSPTYAVDAARAIWDIVVTKKPAGVYHVTNGGMATWFEFAKAIVGSAGLQPELQRVSHTAYPSRAVRPAWSPLASERGISLRPWQDALSDYVAWLPANGDSRA
jgi:dTDP-4-dehydrorhamnose reductase